jgi:glyceraldehyde 3-phosphate dehydrogenase
MKIGINGMGRIGRAIIRAIAEYDLNFELVAANGTSSIEEYAHLLKYDSVHGICKSHISIQGNKLHVGKMSITMMQEHDPANINWGAHEVALVLECSGKFNTKALASKHLQSSVGHVITSAPCHEGDVTIIYGVNEQSFSKHHQVISAGSCTTNAFATIAKIIHDGIGIESGFMTTVHSYTNDQNLLDGTHKDIRRARACALSMVPTSTGAAKTIGLIIPELAGKIDGGAIRVPTPNVSLIDFCFNAKRSTSKEEVNNLILQASKSHYQNIVGYALAELVSIDFNHTTYSSIFDPFCTKVVNNNFVRVVSWYDNEWGFAMRMLDIARMIGSK